MAGGVTETCTTLTTQALEQIVAGVHAVSTPKVSEMEELLENIFRSVNIALVNELAQPRDWMDEVSIWEVVQAAKPFGVMPFHPGPGLGGPCIPIDPHVIAEYAPSVVDTRNALAAVDDPAFRAKITLLGGGKD
ncbi:MAG: hypothetical protein ABEL97_04030 [Salinibacter sp.]